jgi:hypothetical protein
MSDCIARQLANLACVVTLVELRERDAHACTIEQGSVVESRADAVEGVGQILQRVEQHRDFLARELVGDDPRLCAAGDDGLHPVTLGERNRATDLGCASDAEHDASTRQKPGERLASRRMQQHVLVLCARRARFRGSPDRAASTDRRDCRPTSRSRCRRG